MAPSFRFLFSLLAALGITLTAVAQDVPTTFRKVDPIGIPNDKADVFTLHFGYYPPRIITVDVPGKGKKQVWYMLFQVWNKSENPQLIVPEFELVTKDPDLPGSYLDQPQPTVLKQIRELEDKRKAMNIKSTIEITKNKIPVTQPDSYPNAVTGVAIWADVPEKASKANRFSVYVTGLSNGYYEEKGADGTVIVKRKTLQLDFFKPTDDVAPKIDDVKTEDNKGLGGENWLYRTSSFRKATGEKPVEK